jgi:hypothetical protein
MSIVLQKVQGELISRDSRWALLLDDSAEDLFLSFAYPVLESTEMILPELVLDDWGKEIASMKLYEWIRENGLHFPRAEIFGFNPNGHPQQYFLRELDLMSKYPCFAFNQRDYNLDAGLLIEAVLILNDKMTESGKMGMPSEIQVPLRYIQASWWQVRPESRHDFKFE